LYVASVQHFASTGPRRHLPSAAHILHPEGGLEAFLGVSRFAIRRRDRSWIAPGTFLERA